MKTTAHNAALKISLPAAAALGLLPVGASAQTPSPRQRLSFNENWRFYKGELSDAKPLGEGYAIKQWRWKAGQDVLALTEDGGSSPWKNALPAEDVFKQQNGFAWFRTTLAPVSAVKAPAVLRFAGVDDNATVYLNGKQIFTHQGWNESFEVPLQGVLKPGVPNELAVLVENTENTGGIGEVEFQVGPPQVSAARTPAFADASWRQVDLPHDWGIEGPFDIDLPGETAKLPWAGVGWYRKRFNLPASDKGRRITLQVDGAMSNASVWVNGQHIGVWPYGYTSWAFDITPALRYGAENVVSIRLDNPEQSSRWYPGGGIYRNVWLTKISPVRVDQWGTQVSTVGTKVNAKVFLKNDTPAASDVRIVNTVLDAAKKPVAKAESRARVGAKGEATASTALQVPGAKKWSLKTPYLYTLVTQVVRGSQVLDRYETAFGVRDIKWDAVNGFLLNGERVQLNGVCLHHDLGALGAAWNTRAGERQLQIMKQMGVNAIRTSHNPPAPEFLDLCDRMGFVVLDEFSDTWTRAKKPNGYARIFKDWAEKDLRGMIHRDRNHPSIIAWSIGNEIPEQSDAAGHVYARMLTDIVHSEDLTRPVTSGNDQVPAGYNGWEKITDVFGYNYKPWEYAKFRAANPNIPLYGSETSSAISSRGEYFFPLDRQTANVQVNSYDVRAVPWGSTPDREWEDHDKNPFVAGEFVWTGFDYLGEPTPYNSDSTTLTNFADPVERAKAEAQLRELGRVKIPSRSSYFGIVDLAGFKKDRFYLYQSRWRPDLPMAHILPHWNWPERVGQVTPVFVYTSGDEGELFLNGKSLGRKKKAPLTYRLRWDDVVYEPGELKVVTYKNGKEWAQETVETTGPATRLMMDFDRGTIKNDGKDLSFITVRVADQYGRPVPRSKNPLTFSISGPGEIVATDNGDATDLTTFSSKERKAFNGLALVIVRAKKGQSGKIDVKVTSPGLTSSQIRISAEK